MKISMNVHKGSGICRKKETLFFFFIVVFGLGKHFQNFRYRVAYQSTNLGKSSGLILMKISMNVR